MTARTQSVNTINRIHEEAEHQTAHSVRTIYRNVRACKYYYVIREYFANRLEEGPIDRDRNDAYLHKQNNDNRNISAANTQKRFRCIS